MTSDLKQENASPPPVVLTPLYTPSRGGVRVQHMMYAVGVCAFLSWLVALAARSGNVGVWVFLGLFFLTIGGSMGLAVFFVRRNLVQQETLLRALAISAERSLPLAPAALAFADQYGNAFRWRIQLLAALLNEGMSLQEALDQVPNLLSREADVLVRTGDATGTLGRSLREAAALRAARDGAWGWIAARVAYLTLVIVAIEASLLFVVANIGPRLESITQDFRVELSPITVATFRVSHFLFEDFLPVTIVVVVFEVAVLLLLPLSQCNVFQWNIPLLDALFRRRHSAMVLRCLALAVEGERPLSEGLAVISAHYPSAWVKTRLRRAERDVANGRFWVDSLAANGLLRSTDAAVLASAERVGNLEWALRETAAAGERRIGYRLEFWMEILIPFVVVLLGVLVLVVCVAYFLPLVRMIEALTG